ncbi:MAG: nuclear transport factor 2 family protein [Actinomycetota bacterium]|nr:nuclear transport factor 2 family protein [Actinomycetota bacterium]
MPDGVLQWLDPSTGVAGVVRNTHRYRAELSDIEPAARHAGARIHFDIERRDGVEQAVRVTLRRGRRVSPQQHRFGTLQGARRRDTKGSSPFARPHPEIGTDLPSRPLDVVGAWAEAVVRRDLDGALLLYAPDAVVHTDDEGPLTGRRHLHAHLDAFATNGPTDDAEVRGDGDDVIVSWVVAGARATDAGGRGVAASGDEVVVRSRVEHGQVVEQWFGDAARDAGAAVADEVLGDTLVIEVVTDGIVDEDLAELARTKVEKLIDPVPEPVLLVRVKLAVPGEAERVREAEAEMVVDVNGDLLRASATSPELRDAIDHAAHTLREQLHRRSARRVRARKPRRGRTPRDH